MTSAAPILQHTPSAPLANSPDAQAFYTKALQILRESEIPFLVAGTFAVSAYTGIHRPTKDIDIFCKPGDYPRILQLFTSRGFEAQVPDERWLAKIFCGEDFFDVIFNSTAAVTPVNDSWFEEVREADVLGCRVRIVPPTELIWSKAFVQNRERYDGADIVHMILKEKERINWQRLLTYMEQYWEVLLMHVLNFRFVYPSERHLIPDWLMKELLERLTLQDSLPIPQVKVCRGRMFSRADYLIDIEEWGFVDITGEGR